MRHMRNMKLLDREAFLREAWTPYPAAESDWSDVGDYLANPHHSATAARVCGRLARRESWNDPSDESDESDSSNSSDSSDPRGSRGAWRLVSNGASLALTFSADACWLEPGPDPNSNSNFNSDSDLDSAPDFRRGGSGVVFSETMLREGDLVCVSVVRASMSSMMPAFVEASGVGREEISVLADGCLLLVPVLTEKISSRRSSECSSGRFDVQRSKLWAEFLSEIRAFFVSRGFIEALTPTLDPSPGTEPFLEPFATMWEIGSRRRELFLPTSPEFHLKKMLVRGWTRVFEFKTCFRNGEIGAHHQPEFLMLEWYRAYRGLDAIADDVEDLIATLWQRFHGSAAAQAPSQRLTRTTMAELFARKLEGFRLTPSTSRAELMELAIRHGVAVSESDDWDDVFFRLFLEKVENDLGANEPLLVRGYPPSQAALSRIGPDGFADRFEVYWRGLEIANAFHELNDPVGNETRFREDAEKKRVLGKKPVPVDEELIDSLYEGMPPSGGIALGLDRLFMALFGFETIEETRAFPLL